MKTEHFSQKIHFADKCYLTLSTLISTLLALVLPFSILIIFDKVLPNHAIETLFLLFAIIVGAIFLDYLLKNQEEKMTSRIMKRFETRLTHHLFHAICSAQIARFRQLEPGEYLERIATIPEIKTFFGGELIRAFINVAVSIATIGIIGLINIWAAVTLLCASLVLALFALSISKQKVRQLADKSDIEGLTTSKIIEMIASPLDIKARTMEHRVENLMTHMIEEREVQCIQFERLEAKLFLLLSLIQQLAMAGVVVVLANAVIEQQASQGVMAAIILLTNRYFSPYQQVIRTLGRWALYKMQVQRIAQLLDLQSHDTKVNKAKLGLKESATQQSNENAQQGNEKIHFHSISVKLDLKRRVEFEQGQAYLISGRSGSGKSHLAHCISRETATPRFDIQVDAHSLTHIGYEPWRQQVLLINKASAFVDGTIIDNLTCFRPSLNTTAFALCETMNIKAIIDSLPHGFYTELKGHLRPPFSRQVNYALLIVRALLANKSILIFDDLDTVFDDSFGQTVLASAAYRSNDKTLIIISNKLDKLNHRLTRIKLTRDSHEHID